MGCSPINFGCIVKSRDRSITELIDGTCITTTYRLDSLWYINRMHQTFMGAHCAAGTAYNGFDGNEVAVQWVHWGQRTLQWRDSLSASDVSARHSIKPSYSHLVPYSPCTPPPPPLHQKKPSFLPVLPHLVLYVIRPIHQTTACRIEHRSLWEHNTANMWRAQSSGNAAERFWNQLIAFFEWACLSS